MYVCDICGLANVEAAVTKRHKKTVHEKIYDNVCHICGKSFSLPWKLQSHLAKVHSIGQAKFTCDICGKICLSSSQLKIHKQGVHLRNIEFPCDQCGHISYTKPALYSHKRKVHTKKLQLKKI